MKKIKHKLFYLVSFFIYCIFALVAILLSLIYLEPELKGFFISSFAASKVGSPNIIEIVIDDASIGKYQWPWPKYMYTELLDYFHTYAKPKVIGFDLIPSINPMSKADVDFVKQVGKMDNLVTGFIPDESFSEGSNDKFLNDFKKKYALKTDYKTTEIHSGYNIHIPKLYLDNSKYFGSVKISKNSIFEDILSALDIYSGSGIVFSTTNIVKIGDAYYPSLPLKMYLYENSANEVTINPENIIVNKTGLKIPHNLVSNADIQTDIRYYQNIRYQNKHNKFVKSDYTHYALSAYAIIDSYRNLKAGKPQKGDIDPSIFKDAIVFIGANISGPSADVLNTPMSERHPGVDVQATVYDNLSNNQFMHTVGFGIQFFVLLVVSLLTFLSVFRLKLLKSMLSILMLDTLFFGLVAFCAYCGYLMSFIVPISVQLVTLIFGYSFKFITENRNKEKIKQAMGKYLSQDIMKNVVSNIDDLKLGGKRAVVTVLFSDIRGFTSLSEKMSAEEVSMILNEYFAEMEPIISKYNGVINKFIGDAVMAIFGEPIQDIDHPKNAVKCAYEMLKKVEYLREKWLYEGKPKIEIGVGINTGEVFIGNIGTENRMEYTVIGDTVNLASRIESYNKVYKTNLLVSSSTYEYIADIADVIKISEVHIRGKAKKMDIYEVLRIDKDR